MSDSDQSSFDSRAFRNALGLFATGVTIMTALDDGNPHGMTANAFVSVSLDPPLVLISVDHRSNMHRILQKVDRYGVSMLAEHQEPISNHFADQPQEGLEVPFISQDGVPLVDEALAYFVVRVTDAHVAGDHTLYIGEVEHFASHLGQPLLFYGGKYRRLAEE
jgi:flavin reductase (DIM6/NTAB) family NADH-FMN oxidoreductase RutF